MPAWIELVAGIAILIGGLWKGSAEIDKVGNPIPEGFRGTLELEAEYREG